MKLKNYAIPNPNILSAALIFILSAFFACCSDYPMDVRRALDAAGDNRTELEKVLQHYRQYPQGSLKLRAAEFIIANMPGHYSYRDTDYVSRYYKEIEAMPAKGRDSLYRAIVGRYIRPDTVEDLRIVKADFLIGNIDEAFRSWKESEWAQHLDFDGFCEYLLPYKVCELQALDDWRTYLANYGDTTHLSRLHYCRPYQNSAHIACEALNRKLSALIRPGIKPRFHPPVQIRGMKALLNIPFGTCDDYNILVAAIMRAHGIPVGIDHIFNWPTRSMGHGWNLLFDTTGKVEPFEGAGEEKVMQSFRYEPTGKIFRRTYAHNKEIDELLRMEPHVKKYTSITPFNKDVTAEYQQTTDIEIPAPDSRGHAYAFLCVFDNTSWKPVFWGKIKNGKALFKNMGRRVVYMPAFCGAKGMEPFGEPVMLAANGEIRRLKADTEKKKTLILNRKYPVMEAQYYIAWRVVGGRIQADNDGQFACPSTLHTITAPGFSAGKIDLGQTAGNFRCWRYFPPDGAYCNMAELRFYEKGSNTPLTGRIIGADGSLRGSDYTKDAVFDGDALTYFDAPRPDSCWVGMDFGREVQIDRIVYIPRSDGNSVEPGDEYELCYWDGGQWKSLGRKQAQDVELTYGNCPANALYILHNHTKGKEERIFTYEEGKQMWW